MKKHLFKHKKLYIGLISSIIVLTSLYLFLIYLTHPFISKWRTIYIETAMTTNTHQWLATAFIPKDIIDKVMSDRDRQESLQEKLESTWNPKPDSSITENITTEEVLESSESISSEEEIIEPVKTEEELFLNDH